MTPERKRAPRSPAFVSAVSVAKNAAAIIAGAALLLSVVVLNGRPTVFADTNIYFWMGELQTRPLRYAVGPIIGGPASEAQDPDLADEKPADMSLRRTEMGSRSPWFGLTLWSAATLGSLWTYAALQSLAASYAVRCFWRGVGGQTGGYLAVMAALAVGTTLPFFVGFAMPDLWAGVGLVASATLLFGHGGLGGLGRLRLAALFVLVVAAQSFHHSNMPVAVLATACAVLAAGMLWRIPWGRLAPGVGVVLCAMAAATALEGGYGAVIEASTGQSLRSPPFLAARLLADGPGRAYLRRSCAHGGAWALCRFKALPLDDSQEILWSGDPKKGVFGRSNVRERIHIDQEQTRFIAAVIAFDPIGSAKTAVINAWRTLTTVNLEDPLRSPHFYLTDPDWRDTYVADLVHEMGPCGPSENDCRSRFEPSPLADWHGAVCLVGLAWLLLAAFLKKARVVVFGPELGPVIVFLLAATLFNAAVLGAVSGPFPRYQARIAWLEPLAALMALGAVLRRYPVGQLIRRRRPSLVEGGVAYVRPD